MNVQFLINNTMKTISKKEAYSKMINSKGVIFGAKFIKKDGTVRRMACRTGVYRYVTGSGLRYNPLLKGLFGVFDMNSSYRMVNLRTLQEVSFNGVRYKVNQFTNVFDF